MDVVRLITFAIAVVCISGQNVLENFDTDSLSGYDKLTDQVISSLTALSVTSSRLCLKDLNATLIGYRQRRPWAIAMYDSSVKAPSGIEYGKVFQFGSFDECLDIQTSLEVDNVNIKPKYCLADVEVTDYQVRHEATRNRDKTNSVQVHWGICMPASCSASEIQSYLASLSGHDHVHVDPSKCTTRSPAEYSTTDIMFGCVMVFMVSMVLFSTIYHVVMIYSGPKKARSSGCFDDLMKSFSIVENLQKLGKESNDELGLSCVNGIKAIAMFFIVGGHALVFMVGGPVQNSGFYEQQSTMIQNSFFLNSPLLVDSFLLLSGFLLTRLLLLELEKRRGKINFALLYVFRYIRLTPAYFAMIGLYSTWLIKMGDGPIWNSRISVEQERCENSWWKNLLYINNYFGNEQLCMFQSWYLAADTQLFILAPILIYPLWRCRKLGLYLLGAVAGVSIAIPFYVTYSQSLDPSFIAFSDEISDLSANEYFINTYGKTHMRATAYIFGVIVGFLVHYIQEKGISLSTRAKVLFWISSIVIGSYSMFSITLYYDPAYKYSLLESATYASLHRVGWSYSTGWLVLACVIGYGGPLQKFLASRTLAPISRLTYCAYLTNGFIELYLAGSIRTPRYLSVFNLVGDTLSHITLTFTAALVLCLMFESPIHGMEKILLRRHSHIPQHKTSNDELNNNQNSGTASVSESGSV